MLFNLLVKNPEEVNWVKGCAVFQVFEYSVVVGRKRGFLNPRFDISNIAQENPTRAFCLTLCNNDTNGFAILFLFILDSKSIRS